MLVDGIEWPALAWSIALIELGVRSAESSSLVSLATVAARSRYP